MPNIQTLYPGQEFVEENNIASKITYVAGINPGVFTILPTDWLKFPAKQSGKWLQLLQTSWYLFQKVKGQERKVKWIGDKIFPSRLYKNLTQHQLHWTWRRTEISNVTYMICIEVRRLFAKEVMAPVHSYSEPKSSLAKNAIGSPVNSTSRAMYSNANISYLPKLELHTLKVYPSSLQTRVAFFQAHVSIICKDNKISLLKNVVPGHNWSSEAPAELHWLRQTFVTFSSGLVAGLQIFKEKQDAPSLLSMDYRSASIHTYSYLAKPKIVLQTVNADNSFILPRPYFSTKRIKFLNCGRKGHKATKCGVPQRRWDARW